MIHSIELKIQFLEGVFISCNSSHAILSSKKENEAWLSNSTPGFISKKPKNTNLKRWAVLCYARSFQLCPTLSSLMDYSPPGSSIHGIPQARRLERVVDAFLQGILHTQGSNPHFLHISCTGRQVLYHLGSPLKRYMHPNTHSSIIYNSRIWKQHKCSSTDEWVKMWCFIYVYTYMYMYIYTHTHTVQYYSAIRMKFCH